MIGRVVKFWAAAALGTATMFAGNVPLGTTVSITGIKGSVTPYSAVVGGITENVICDDPYDYYPTSGSYSAYVTQVSELPTSGSNGFLTQTMYASLPSATKLYDELAFLAMKVVSGSSGNADIQNAIWYLVNNDFASHPAIDAGLTISPLGSLSAAAQGWVSLAMAQNFPVSGYAPNVEILTPTCTVNGVTSACKAGSTPAHSQEFIVVMATPEPTTYALFGSGLILLSLGTFRRRKYKRNS